MWCWLELITTTAWHRQAVALSMTCSSVLQILTLLPLPFSARLALRAIASWHPAPVWHPQRQPHWQVSTSWCLQYCLLLPPKLRITSNLNSTSYRRFLYLSRLKMNKGATQRLYSFKSIYWKNSLRKACTNFCVSGISVGKYWSLVSWELGADCFLSIGFSHRPRNKTGHNWQK